MFFPARINLFCNPNPVCCSPGDSAQAVAKIMYDRNIGSIPVVIDQESRELAGVITDRDLCCCGIASGLDAKTTPIQKLISLDLSLAAIEKTSTSAREQCNSTRSGGSQSWIVTIA
jgi:signal-transduction protein with cAMP-binding, CBS, and nucleotidyltransferase domain